MASNGKSVCEKCKKNINFRTSKYINCEGECKKLWHIPNCFKISEEKYLDIINSDVPWFCISCASKRKEQRHSLRKSINAGFSTTPLSNTPSNSVNSIPDDVHNENISLNVIYNEIKQIKKQQEQFQKSINNLEIILNDYKEIVENLTKENIDLRNDNVILHNKVNDIVYQMDNTEQSKLNHNFVLNGIDKTDDEVLEDVVVKISNAINADIKKDDIKSVKRMSTTNVDSGLPGSIVVVLHDKEKRDIVLNKKKTKITNEILSNASTAKSRNIYISEHLSAKRQYLFKIARDIKRDGTIQFAWVKNGEVFIRKKEKSKIIKIKNVEQLRQQQHAYESE